MLVKKLAPNSYKIVNNRDMKMLYLLSFIISLDNNISKFLNFCKQKNANLGVRRFTFALAGRLATNPNTKIYVGVGWVKLKANLDLHKNTWYNTTVFLTKGEVKYGIDT